MSESRVWEIAQFDPATETHEEYEGRLHDLRGPDPRSDSDDARDVFRIIKEMLGPEYCHVATLNEWDINRYGGDMRFFINIQWYKRRTLRLMDLLFGKDNWWLEEDNHEEGSAPQDRSMKFIAPMPLVTSPPYIKLKLLQAQARLFGHIDSYNVKRKPLVRSEIIATLVETRADLDRIIQSIVLKRIE